MATQPTSSDVAMERQTASSVGSSSVPVRSAAATASSPSSEGSKETALRDGVAMGGKGRDGLWRGWGRIGSSRPRLEGAVVPRTSGAEDAQREVRGVARVVQADGGDRDARRHLDDGQD